MLTQSLTHLIKALQDQQYKTDPTVRMERPILGVDNGLRLFDMVGLDYDDPKWDALLDQLTFDEIVSVVSTRRYTQSRIRRILCNLLINNCFKAVPEPTYIRPLAFNETGSKALKEMKKTASLPIRTRGGAIKDDDIFLLLVCRRTKVR